MQINLTVPHTKLQWLILFILTPNIQTDMPKQTVYLKELFDQGLQCLPFSHHFIDKMPVSQMHFFKFKKRLEVS